MVNVNFGRNAIDNPAMACEMRSYRFFQRVNSAVNKALSLEIAATCVFIEAYELEGFLGFTPVEPRSFEKNPFY
jgi:hypothetical protein